MSQPDRVSGYGKIIRLEHNNGVIEHESGFKIYFTPKSTVCSAEKFRGTFAIGEFVAYSANKKDKPGSDCKFIAHQVRKPSELTRGKGNIEFVQEKFGAIKDHKGTQIFFPGQAFKNADGERNLTKNLSKEDQVDFLALKQKTKDGQAEELIAVSVSKQKAKTTKQATKTTEESCKVVALLVVSNAKFSILWSKYHGKIYCPRNIIKDPKIGLGSWLWVTVESQENKNDTCYKATAVIQSRKVPDVQVDQQGNRITVCGEGLVCASLQPQTYIWSSAIGRLVWDRMKFRCEINRLCFVKFKAQFNLSAKGADNAWYVTMPPQKINKAKKFPDDVIYSSEAKVIDIKSNFGFINAQNVGVIFARPFDYDGENFSGMKGRDVTVAYVPSFSNGKRGFRALYFTETV